LGVSPFRHLAAKRGRGISAERVAKRNDTSVSRLIVDALTEHLPKAAAEPVRDVRWSDIAADAA
jgi:hypothetical protein